MYWLTPSDYTSALCHCWSTANCFLNCLSFDTRHHSEKQAENKFIVRVTLLIKMLEQSRSARETRRDDIWKYQTLLRGALLLSVLTFKQQRINSSAGSRMPFIQLLEPGSHVDLYVVILDYPSLQNSPCQEQKTQDRFQSLSFLTGHLGDATTLRRPQPQAIAKKSTFPTDPGARLHSLRNDVARCCKEPVPALLTSRWSLWKIQPGWHKQTPCFVVVRALSWEENPRSKLAQINFLQQWNCPSGQWIVKLLSESFKETRIRKSIVRRKKRKEKRQNRREEAFLLGLGKGTE